MQNKMISHRDHRGRKERIFRKGFPFVFTLNFVRNNPSSSVSPRSVPSAFSPQPSAFSHGFSLVEVSLALLIVGVAMLSILGMFPAGLEQNARSISDTHSALFADEVFGSLRVYAETNWEGIGHSVASLSASASSINWWPPDGIITNYLDDAVRTNIYRHPDNSNLVDHAFRYRISLSTNGLIKTALVRFWPGEYGTTNNPSVFYSEFYKSYR